MGCRAQRPQTEQHGQGVSSQSRRHAGWRVKGRALVRRAGGVVKNRRNPAPWVWLGFDTRPPAPDHGSGTRAYQLHNFHFSLRPFSTRLSIAELAKSQWLGELQMVSVVSPPKGPHKSSGSLDIYLAGLPPSLGFRTLLSGWCSSSHGLLWCVKPFPSTPLSGLNSSTLLGCCSSGIRCSF